MLPMHVLWSASSDMSSYLFGSVALKLIFIGEGSIGHHR